jgi:hypothetical protein
VLNTEDGTETVEELETTPRGIEVGSDFALDIEMVGRVGIPRGADFVYTGSNFSLAILKLQVCVLYLQEISQYFHSSCVYPSTIHHRSHRRVQPAVHGLLSLNLTHPNSSLENHLNRGYQRICYDQIGLQCRMLATIRR